MRFLSPLFKLVRLWLPGTVSIRCRVPLIAGTLLVAGLGFSESTIAADYYISKAGSDAHDGLTLDSSWATLVPANKMNLVPGDRILLEGGSGFPGPLLFDSEDRGTPKAPVVVTSYGEGRAFILAGAGVGIMALNTAGIFISDIEVIGSGRTDNESDGVSFYLTRVGEHYFQGITILRMVVHGFGRNGIAIGSWNSPSGFQDVKIQEVEVYDNGLSGIVTYAESPRAHKSVYIGYSKVYRNAGSPDVVPSGNGIVLGSVDGGVIERSQAFENGWQGDGGVGIWTYESTNIHIQHNEAHHNQTAGTRDGGGFGLDGGVTHSLMQYNFSHENDGAGFLLCQYAGASFWSKNIVRHNLSIDDGRNNSYAGILVWNNGTGLDEATIYDNQIVMGKTRFGSPTVLQIRTEGTRRFSISNNVFVTIDARVSLVIASGQTNLNVAQNMCWPQPCLRTTP
ncbi:MAG: right-handed parallel beta-helix repeat-containing protein [Nitrospirota bacterium]